MLFGQQLGFGLAKPHRATFAAALHAVHEINPHTDQKQEGQKANDKGLKARLLLLFGPCRNVIFDQQFCDGVIFGLDGDMIRAIRGPIAHLFAINDDRVDGFAFNCGHEV